MIEKQAGMTAIGWLIVLALIGLFAIAGIRLIPLYLENVKVTSVLKSVKTEYDGKQATPQELRRAIKKRFDVDSINALTSKDVKITREDDKYLIDATYEQRAPFLANLEFLARFSNTIEVTR